MLQYTWHFILTKSCGLPVGEVSLVRKVCLLKWDGKLHQIRVGRSLGEGFVFTWSILETKITHKC